MFFLTYSARCSRIRRKPDPKSFLNANFKRVSSIIIVESLIKMASLSDGRERSRKIPFQLTSTQAAIQDTVQYSRAVSTNKPCSQNG